MVSGSRSNQPSQFQLAFALTIAKTKPVSLTIRDYITKIRQYLTDGNAANDYGSRESYLDAAGHWQSMYQQSQREIDHLQTSVSVLEREKVQLEAQLANMHRESAVQDDGAPKPSTAQQRSSAPKRRKMPFKDDTQLQYKKLKTGNEMVLVVDPATAMNIDELAQFEESKVFDATITRHLLSIHKLYQVISPDCSDLAHHLVEATRKITEHITSKAVDIQNQLRQASLSKDRRTCSQRMTAILAELNNEFRKSERAAARSIISLFHGLITLWAKGIESGRRNHGVVTYEMICAFDSLLEAIETTCSIQAKMTAEDEACSTGIGTGTEASKKKKDKRVDKVPVPQELTTLMLALLSGLTPRENGPHTAFFEGYLYLLLDRVAKKLFLMTFKHARCATIEAEIALGNVEEPDLYSVTLKAASLEVQFLVQLIERAMSLAPGFLGSLSSSAATNRSKTTRPGTGTQSNPKAKVQEPSLSIAGKEKLQHTLVRCMFGEFPRTVHSDDSETEDEESPNNEFVDVLRKPVQMRPVPPSPKVEDADIPSWFREEIWRLVGWDILSREDGW